MESIVVAEGFDVKVAFSNICLECNYSLTKHEQRRRNPWKSVSDCRETQMVLQDATLRQDPHIHV